MTQACDPARDRGALVIGWLTKLVVVLAVLAVLGYDLIAVAAARVGVNDDAQSALQAAVTAYHDHPDVQTAYRAAVDAAAQHQEELPPEDFIVGPDGEISLTVVRPISTLVLRHVPMTRQWATTATSRVAGHWVG